MEKTQQKIPEQTTKHDDRVTIVIGRNQFGGGWEMDTNLPSLHRFTEVGCIVEKADRNDKIILIFPEGWTSVISPISKWTSYLYDEKGQYRGTIDFTDYFGNQTYAIRPASRITLYRKYDIFYESGTYDVREYPGENILFTPTIPKDTPDQKIYSVREKMCKEYLNKHFPCWKDPLAYW